MTEATRGLLGIITCCTIWGLSGIYYKFLDHVPAAEVIAHRTLWSMVLFGLVLLIQGRLVQVFGLVKDWKTFRVLVLSAAMISVNWTAFVFSVHQGWALEASLGYYIFPLMAVVLGVVLFRERLQVLQWMAVALAAVAVIVLAVGLGATPWMSLLLATTFSIYGILKRGVEIGPVASVFLEVMIVAPIAVIYLAWVHSGPSSAFGSDAYTSLMLIGSGPMTAIPLILFSYGARRIDFATVGLAQYLNPSLQFLVAVLLFGEVFTRWHAITLPMIWLALMFYSISAFRQARLTRLKTTPM